MRTPQFISFVAVHAIIQSSPRRSDLGGSSPDLADTTSPSPPEGTVLTADHPTDLTEALLQHPTMPAISSRTAGPSAGPSSPFAQVANGEILDQTSSKSMSIPNPSPQPASLQSPAASSAPTDLRGHIHCWPDHGSSQLENGHEPAHQLPHAAPPIGQFEQGSMSHAADGQGHHVVRRSALHGIRSSQHRGDGRAPAGGHGIQWNDSRDSLWSSQEDLAQLVPDRASKDGVEQSPEAVSFTGQTLYTASSICTFDT